MSDPNYGKPAPPPHYQPQPVYQSPPPAPEASGGGYKIPTLFGAVLALVGSNVYQYVQMDKMHGEMGKMRESILAEVQNVKSTADVTTQTSRRNQEQIVANMTAQLAAERRAAAQMAGDAKAGAEKKAEALAARLDVEQKKASALLEGKVAEVKEVASAATARIGEVSTEVGGVKTDVANTRTELEKTIADLKRTSGDLGVQSGLIATNSKELGALRALGERNYFEFNLGKTKEPQRVGDITLLLKKTDQKRNKYTIEVVADDKRTEKKDKNINEPVQFLVAKGGRIPYEIIVNEVKKDQIVGYLATPKVTAPR